MRPLMAAEPMLRAPRPEMVSESTVTGLVLGGAATGADSPALGGCAGSAAPSAVTVSEASTDAGASLDFVPGMTKRALAMGTFASILLTAILERKGLPLRAFLMEYGRYQPLTLL